jgi:superfamily II DNA helicase RecQ
MLETAVKRMDDAQLSSKIECIVGFRPRPGQVQAIRRLVVEEDDLILIAPTGWGKSVVFQAVPALAGGICIMIMPLMLLQEDQVSNLLSATESCSYYLPASFHVGCRNISHSRL